MPKTTDTQAQPPLPFPAPIIHIPYVEVPANADALARINGWLEHHEDGAERSLMLAISGGEGVGKTRLLRNLVEKAGGVLIRPDEEGALTLPVTDGLLAVDDADRAHPLSLISLYNEAVSRNRPMVLAGRGRVDRWGADAGAPPDLASRLSSIPVVSLDGPDAGSLARALKGALESAGVRLPPGAYEKAAASLQRRFSAVEAVAASAVKHAANGDSSAKGLLQAAMNDNPDAIL